MDTPQPENITRWVKLTYSDPKDSLLRKCLIEGLEFATGRKRIERIYNEIQVEDIPARELWTRALEKLEVGLAYDVQRLQQLPAEGPLIFIANHPFGVVDGLMLGHLVAQARERFFVLVNEVLCRDQKIAPYMLPIDFRETREAMQTNIESRKRAVERLQQGQALAIFPAGGVATARKAFGKAEDLEWKRFVAKLIQQSRATVVPVFFHGQNSRIFQLASRISMALRYGLFLHEARNKRGTVIHATIGDPIPYEEMAAIRGRQALLDYLRERTFSLGQ